MNMLHPVVAEVTERLRERSRDTRAAYLRRIDAATGPARTASDLSCGNLAHGFAACGSYGQGTRCATATPRQSRHRHRLQRHALGASAVRALPGTDPPGRARRRRHRAGRRRRAGHVRRRYPGTRRHGAVAVLARPDRHGDRGIAVARHVRRRAVPRHLRQDRARPADRRAQFRPPARRVRARRPDAQRHSATKRSPRCARPMPRARPAARNCSKRKPPRTTRPAPAPSTAPPTPTRC